MHRFRLYPFVVCRFAMNCFACSGSFRLACLLMVVSALSVNLIVYLLLFWFFILISMLRMVWVSVKRAGVLVVTRLLFVVAFG